MQVERLIIWMAERGCQLTVTSSTHNIRIQLDASPGKIIRVEGGISRKALELSTSPSTLVDDTIEALIKKIEVIEKERADEEEKDQEDPRGVVEEG